MVSMLPFLDKAIPVKAMAYVEHMLALISLLLPALEKASTQCLQDIFSPSLAS